MESTDVYDNFPLENDYSTDDSEADIEEDYIDEEDLSEEDLSEEEGEPSALNANEATLQNTLNLLNNLGMDDLIIAGPEYNFIKALMGKKNNEPIKRIKNYEKFEIMAETPTTTKTVLETKHYTKESFVQLYCKLVKGVMNETNNREWILPDEIKEIELTQEEEIAFNTDFMNVDVFSEVRYILNIESVSEEDNDGHFMLYYDACNNVVQHIIGLIMDSMNYNFDIMEKLMWVFMMLAAKYEHRAIKYLINSPFYNPTVLLMKDMSQQRCCPLEFILADYTDLISDEINNDLIECSKLYIKKYGFTPMLYACSSIDNLKRVVSQIKEMEPLLFDPLNTVFAYSCLNNVDMAKYLLQIDSLSEKFVKTSFRGINILMIAMSNDPELMFLILESPYCDLELVEHSHPNYGTILSVMANFDSSVIKRFIESYPQYVTEKNINMVYSEENSMSILVELLHDMDTFMLITQLPQFNNSLISPMFMKVLSTANTNTDIFKKLYTGGLLKDKITDENLLSICTYDISFGIELFNDMEITESILDCTYHNMNIIMILCKVGKLKDVYKKLESFITTEILNLVDNDNYSTYSYICKFAPEIAIELLDSPVFSKTILEKEYLDESIMLHVIFCISNNTELLNKILKSDYVTEEMMDKQNTEGNNFILEVFDYGSNEAIKCCLQSEKLTIEQFRHVNCEGINILFSSEGSGQFKEVVNHPYFDKDMYKSTDINGNNILHYAIDEQNGLETMIKELPADIFKELMLATNKYGESIIMLACKQNNISTLKLILEHTDGSKDMFSTKDINGDTCLYHVFIKSSSDEMLEYMINHENCSEEVVFDAFSKYYKSVSRPSVKIIQLIFETEYCSERILMALNAQKVNVILYLMNASPELGIKILRSKYLTKNIMAQQDSKGNTVLNYISYQDDTLKYLFEHPSFTEELLFLPVPAVRKTCKLLTLLNNSQYDLIKDLIKNGTEKILTTPYHVLGFTLITHFGYYRKNLSFILDLPSVTKETLLYKDVTGKTCLYPQFSRDTGETINLDSINMILKHDKCSSELLESVDNYQHTFLDESNHLLLDVLESPHCTSKVLENTPTLIKELYVEDWFEDLLDNKSFTKEILINNLSNILKSRTLFDFFKVSEYYTTEIMNNNQLCVEYPLEFSEDISILKEMLESNIDFTDTFNSVTNDIPFVENMLDSPYDIYKLFMDSKYITSELMRHINIYGHNIASRMVFNEMPLNNLRYYLDSKYWDEQKYGSDVDGDTLMMFATSSALKCIIEKNKCDKLMIGAKNNANETCLHYYAKKSVDHLQLMLDTDMLTKDIIHAKNMYGQTFLHLASYKGDIFECAINSQYFSNKLAKKRDERGMNVLMICIQYCPSVFKKILSMNKFSMEVFKQVDNSKNNIMMHIIKYAPKLMEEFINSIYFDKSMLNDINENGFNAVKYACKYSANIIKLFLDNKLLKKDMIFKHLDHGSALITAAQYQPLAVKYLLELDGIEIMELNHCRLISTKEGDTFNKNFMEIACIFQPMAVKYAIGSKYDMTTIFASSSSVILATMYQPTALRHILDSKYGSLELLKQKSENKKEDYCLHTAFAHQPWSLKIIIDSEHCTEEYLRIEDDIGYKLFDKMKRIYPNLEDLSQVKELELCNEINEICDEDDSALCNICCTFRTKVIFTPCFHTCCVGCAFRMPKCHICREDIEHRKVLY